MKRLFTRTTLLAGSLLALAALISSLPTGFQHAPETADAAASCPLTLRVGGSTTVSPIAVNLQPSFDAAWPGTTTTVTSVGSGFGISGIRNDTYDLGMSSRPLTAAEAADLYVVQVAGDAFVIAVNNSANMSFLTNITVSQLHDIYAGIITNWNALGGPNQPIVPRARITASGSQPDFNGQVGVTSAQESATIAATGLPRLTESVDMANAVVGVDYQIAYTSLANLDVAGMKTLTVNGIVASPATVIDQTFPLKRRLYMMARGLTLSPVNGQRIDGLDVDYSPLVRADDFLDYVTSATGEAAIAAQGFVSVPSVLVIPDWDINMDGTTGVGDLGEILAKWGLQTNCKGWIRADGNNSGKVSVSDVGTVTGHWAQPGFVPPVYTP